MKRTIIVTGLLAGSLTLPAILLSCEETTKVTPSEPKFTSVNIPQLQIQNPSTLSRFSPFKLWRLAWPAKTTVAAVKATNNATNDTELLADVKEQVDTVAAYETAANPFHAAIRSNARAKGNRLLFCSLGYGLLRGYKALDHSVPLTQGISKLLSQSAKLKTVGWIALFAAGSKVFAPWIIRSWQEARLSCTLSKHLTNLGTAIKTAYKGTVPAEFETELLSDYNKTSVPTGTEAQAIFKRILPTTKS